ncbi:MAG: glycosyltransferase family 2 protein [Verrucomicrobiota bacterium]|nr:glycosyltransferase family 2 protein [Verrucomicrobiota bacterium]
MKKILALVLFLAVSFAGGFYAGKEKKKRVEKREKPKEVAAAFQPSAYPLKNHSFVMVVIGFDNGASVEKTLQSIFSQNYDSYRLIYIDDASDDGSFELAKDLLYESGQMMRVTLVQNERKRGTLANLVRAVRACQDEEIVVVVGGEDWLAHEWVLSRLNQYYANSDLWMTYGQYREYPQYTLGLSKPMGKGELRQKPFTAAHLKTFYAALFKQIPEKELRDGEKFFSASAELAYMFPLLEMAEGHSTFVPDVLYIGNRSVKEDREMAGRAEKIIRSKEPKAALAKLDFKPADPLIEAIGP